MVPLVANNIRIGKKSNQAGGGCMILFGLIFAAAGLLFVFFIGKQAVDEVKTYQWKKVPCEIVRCEIKVEKSRGENPFQLDIQYQYTLNGQSYSSNSYTLREHWSDDYEHLALLRKSLLSNTDHVCYVDPDKPDQATLKREGVGTSLMVLFPMLFVVIGSAIIWGGVSSLRKKKKEKEGTNSISKRGGSSKNGGWKILLFIGLIFTIAGGGIGIPFGVIPIKKMMESRNWVETPCKILWSRVQRHESTSDGRTSITYSIDIFYEYSFNGNNHRSNNYGTIGGSSSGRKGKQKITKLYPTASRRVCFVDPDVPERALDDPPIVP